MLYWNKAFWLSAASPVCIWNLLKCFISAYRSYTTLKLVYDMDSCTGPKYDSVGIKNHWLFKSVPSTMSLAPPLCAICWVWVWGQIKMGCNNKIFFAVGRTFLHHFVVPKGFHIWGWDGFWIKMDLLKDFSNVKS